MKSTFYFYCTYALLIFTNALVMIGSIVAKNYYFAALPGIMILGCIVVMMINIRIIGKENKRRSEMDKRFDKFLEMNKYYDGDR